jgi:hypothetical protein
MTPATPNPLETLPPWAREVSEKYYSRSLAMFILHGNVRDLVPLKGGETTEFVPINRFLREALFAQRDLVLTYDRGGGFSFAEPDWPTSAAPCGYDSFHGTNYARACRAIPTVS